MKEGREQGCEGKTGMMRGHVSEGNGRREQQDWAG